MEANKNDAAISEECKQALLSISEDSLNYKIVLKVSKEKKTLETGEDDLGEISYSRTKQVLAEWAEIRNKYFPESDRWKNDTLQKDDDPYENEE